MIKNFFKIAWRNITRHKVFTVINVAGLALGICACLIIYLISSYEFSFDTFHPDRERIYRISNRMKDLGWPEDDLPAPAPAAIRREIPGIESITSYFPLQATPKIGDLAIPDQQFDGWSSNIIVTGPEYFSIFKYQWLAGNERAALEQPYQVVLTESRARQYFGPLAADKIIGKTVTYDDSLKTTVSGIIRDWAGHSDFGHTDFISYSTISSSFLKDEMYRIHLTDWRPPPINRWPISFVKLFKGVTPEQVNARFASIVKTNMGADVAASFSLSLQPLSDIHFNTDYSHDDMRKAHLPTLYVLMGIAVFILLLAAINFINLATAQSIQRAKEIGVRKVLGSSQANLVFQFLTETFVLTAFSVIMALLLVKPVLALFYDFIPEGVRFHPLNPGTLLFAGLVTGITALLAGLYPARVIASYLPAVSLKGEGAGKGIDKWWLRKGLIVFQFSIALIFIIGTIVISRQISFMLNTDFGFKTNAMLAVYTDWRDKDNNAKSHVLLEKFRHLPGVEKAIMQGNPPAGWGRSTNSISLVGSKETTLAVSTDWGDETFIPFYGMKMVAGRNILKSDSLRELVINETCSRALGFQKPAEAVGRFLMFHKKSLPIVGVVADFHESSFHEAINPLIIGHYPDQERGLGMQLATKGKQLTGVKTTLASMEKIWKSLYPRDDFQYVFIDESIASYYDTEQKTARLMQTAMMTTIIISCLGLFGLALFTAQKRTKEIGIRKVLGAGVANITVLLTRDFLLLVLIALFIASPVAWLVMTKWLQDFAYRIPISGWIFVAAGLAAILIAAVTVSFQAVKAAIANPVTSLRSE